MVINIDWQEILKTIEPDLSRPNFATWLEPTNLITDDTGVATVVTANIYAKNWIEQNCLERISLEIKARCPKIDQVRCVVGQLDRKPTRKKTADSLESPPLLEKMKERQKKGNHNLNVNYTFNSFVVGKNTRLAFAAAQAIADKPGEAYNPLFVYGGVGLGKTHLIQAIGNEIYNRYPDKNILYTSCENFTGEFIQALQTKTVADFKKKYRTVDVLLIDDIQFLANKEGTQEEFFHTFNSLHQSNRQIVMTADRTPREIGSLEDRLTTRLGWGLIADIQSPNFETRLAILKSKAEKKSIDVQNSALEYIANQITSNVRELEGSLVKLAMIADLEGVKEIDYDFARRALKDVQQTNISVSAKQVIRAVAEKFNLEVADLIGSGRKKELVYPRQLVMYILRQNLKQTLPQIGEQLGGRDHTTVMHGFEKIKKLRRSASETDRDINTILDSLKQ